MLLYKKEEKGVGICIIVWCEFVIIMKGHSWVEIAFFCTTFYFDRSNLAASEPGLRVLFLKREAIIGE